MFRIRKISGIIAVKYSLQFSLLGMEAGVTALSLEGSATELISENEPLVP